MVKIRLTRPPSGRSGGPRFIPAGRLMICEWPKETAPTLGGQLGPLWAEMCRWGDRHDSDVGLRSAVANKFRVTYACVYRKPKSERSGDEVVCRGKAQFLRGCESLPARVAPAGSNRSRR